jgi:hypothetical protein
MMTDLKEQQVCIKSWNRLGTAASERHQMLKITFTEETMGRTQTF